MLSIKKHIQEQRTLKKFMQGVTPMYVFVGDYKFNKWDGCRYKVIIGNADFTGCENLNLDNLQYVTGILDISDSHDLNFSLKAIGKGLILSNNHKLNFKGLEKIYGDCIISDTFIDDFSDVKKIKGTFCFKGSKIFNSNMYVDEKIEDELFFEKV